MKICDLINHADNNNLSVIRNIVNQVSSALN